VCVCVDTACAQRRAEPGPFRLTLAGVADCLCICESVCVCACVCVCVCVCERRGSEWWGWSEHVNAVVKTLLAETDMSLQGCGQGGQRRGVRDRLRERERERERDTHTHTHRERERHTHTHTHTHIYTLT